MLLLLLLLLLTLSLGQQCAERWQGCHGLSQAGSDCKDKTIMVGIKMVMMILSLMDEHDEGWEDDGCGQSEHRQIVDKCSIYDQFSVKAYNKKAQKELE